MKRIIAARLALLLATPIYLGAADHVVAPPTAISGQRLVPPNPSEKIASYGMRCSSPGPLCQQLMIWMGCNELIFDPEVVNVECSIVGILDSGTLGSSVAQLQALLESKANIVCEQLPDGVLHFSIGQPKAAPDMAKVRISPGYEASSVETLLGRMKVWSGREIHTDGLRLPAVSPIVLNNYDTDSRTGNLSGLGTLSAAEIFTAARTKLERVGVVLGEQPDGSYRARFVAPPTPPPAVPPAHAPR